jgi:ribosomal protein L7/L12
MPEVFSFEALLDRPCVAAGAEAEVKLLLELESLPGITAANAPASRAMTSNICLVFDCSGSMAGEKRDSAIEAAKLIVDVVHQRHRLSLVGFSSKARVLVDNVQPTPAAKDEVKQQIDRKIRTFPRGTTNLGDALTLAGAVLAKHPADSRVLIVLSDGGADSPRKALNAGHSATAAGVQLFAVGIGAEYEADALLKLVTPSNGAVFGETDLERVKATFEVLIGRIESFVATNASLELTLGEKVRAGTAYKTSPEQAVIGKLDRRLHVGNIERGQRYGFLVALTAPARAAGKLELLRATLSYDAPPLGLKAQRVERRVELSYARAAGAVNERVRDAFQAVQFLELAGGLAEAQRNREKTASKRLLEQLIQRADALGDASAKAFYEDLLEELTERGKIAQDRLNALVLGTSAPPRKRKKGTPLYDVVLVDAGKALIPVVRELRRLTGKELSEVGALVKRVPATVHVLPLLDARALKKELEELGARVSVKPSASEL